MPSSSPNEPDSDPVADLVALLDLETIEVNIFRGVSPKVGWQRVFGGLVIAQALVAATRTVAGRVPHSLHAYFMLGGDPAVPIIYEVDRIRDGRSFTTRRVVAIQHGQAIFSLAASFQIEEPGLEHAFAMPEVPDPESLPTEAQVMASLGDAVPESVRRYFARKRAVEFRPVGTSRFLRRGGKLPAQQMMWVKTVSKLGDDPALHRAVLAYLSDMTLLDTALISHGKSVFDRNLQVASLDHALWFHRSFRADEWLLYVQDSPNTSGGRGLTRGSLYSRDGALVASVAQEGLIRLREPPSA